MTKLNKKQKTRILNEVMARLRLAGIPVDKFTSSETYVTNEDTFGKLSVILTLFKPDDSGIRVELTYHLTLDTVLNASLSI